jgi:DNA-binding NtrC family response regulator
MTTGPARILVVDDEDSILQFVSYNLKKEGYEVETAMTGDEALEHAAATISTSSSSISCSRRGRLRSRAGS